MHEYRYIIKSHDELCIDKNIRLDADTVGTRSIDNPTFRSIRRTETLAVLVQSFLGRSSRRDIFRDYDNMLLLLLLVNSTYIYIYVSRMRSVELKPDGCGLFFILERDGATFFRGKKISVAGSDELREVQMQCRRLKWVYMSTYVRTYFKVLVGATKTRRVANTTTNDASRFVDASFFFTSRPLGISSLFLSSAPSL